MNHKDGVILRLSDSPIKLEKEKARPLPAGLNAPLRSFCASPPQSIFRCLEKAGANFELQGYKMHPFY
jgi:hypothetical protein